MLKVSFQQFEERARRGNLIPVSYEMLADMETPVSVYRKLTYDSEHAFLLESVEGGETIARYSFLGVDPAVILRVTGGVQEIITNDLGLTPQETPIATLRSLLSRYRPVDGDPNLPPFTGGAVGYMAYDTVRYFENIPDTGIDDLALPDCFIMFTKRIVAFDHVKHRMIMIVNAFTDGREGDLLSVYDEAVAQLNDLRARVRRPIPEIPSERPAPAPAAAGAPAHPLSVDDLAPVKLPVSSSMTKEEYMASVEKCREYIHAGDAFQIVLSQRFSTEISCDPFDVYRALRAVNPSPYMFFLKCGEEFQLAGSSPEVMSKLIGGRVTVRPIAGTRPRGATPEADSALADELLADQKEIAEHIMLVDLGRNDIGRVCEYGTVTVDDFQVIERYSHVMHIVSNVTGEISPGKDAIDVIGATFPAGTLSGAPKIRAMEIIDELEVTRRGPYGGCVVYLGFNGAMDSCITIRTAVIRGNQVYVQAGAGLVADSVPETEYMETVSKAKGMLRAIEMAEAGLD